MSGLDFPDYSFDYEYISLQHPDEYPMNEGKLISNKGLDINVCDYEKHFTEEHMHYSTTLHTQLDNDKTVFTGPLARFNMNFDLLSEDAKKLSTEIGLKPACNNPFKSLLVRLVETFHACQLAVDIIDKYEYPHDIYDQVTPKAGKAEAVTEAPRGILFHRYEIDDEGLVMNARIVAPTSHNQRVIEDDLRRVVEQYHNLNDELLTERCEQSVRNYDPCISCSTHFLDVKIERL
jgi:sulfhydrogenase subunit alpha